MKIALAPVIILLVFLPLPSTHSAPPLILTTEDQQSLFGHIYYLEDQQQRFQVQDLTKAATRWQLSTSESFNQGYSQSHWWLKVNLNNASIEPQSRLLEIAYPVLNRLEAYIFDASTGQQLAYYLLGDKQPAHQRPLDHRFFLVPLELLPSQTLTIYLRVSSDSAIQVPLSVWQPSAFTSFDNHRTLLQGLYFGCMLVVTLYNLLMFIVLREIVYLYYVGYVCAIALFVAGLGAIVPHFLWPSFYPWNDKLIVVALSFVVIFSMEFTRYFLNLKKYNRRLNKVLYVITGLGVLALLSSLLLPYSHVIKLVIGLGITACALAFVAGMSAWLKGNHTAIYYLLAWSTILISGIIFALSKINWLPNNPLTETAPQIGSTFEAILLTFALAQRINEERRLRFQAQQSSLDLQRKTNEALELRVKERTGQLEEVNKKLKTLSNTDELTGLNNRRYFERVFEEELVRCYRQQCQVALIMLDIDYFKKINDQHGHLVGDECLKHVARCVQLCLRRQTDRVIRYGGEEFCVLLPDTNQQGATIVAERMRVLLEQMPFVINHHHIPITASFGVYATIPHSQKDSKYFIQRADEALYQAKTNGRNRVEIIAGS